MTATLVTDFTESRSLADFTEQAYLNYSMYVILDREIGRASCRERVYVLV